MRRGKARQLDLIFWGWVLVYAACAWPARLVREVGHLPQVIRMAYKVSLRGRAQAFFWLGVGDELVSSRPPRLNTN